MAIIYWNQPVCPSVYLFVCKLLVSVKALPRVLSHLVTAVVAIVVSKDQDQTAQNVLSYL